MRMAQHVAAWAKSGKPLPYLRRVAYLESDGNQYIKFEAIGEIVDMFCEFAALNTKRGTSVFGKYEYCAYFYRSGTIGFDPNLSDQIQVVAGEKYNYGPLFIPIGTDDDSVPFFLFASAENATAETGPDSFSSSRIFSIKSNRFSIYPVLDLSGRPAMYDEVSGQLFYNQGTGEFTWGELDAAYGAFSTEGGTKCLTPRRSYRRLARPSARFCAHSQEWEVAA